LCEVKIVRKTFSVVITSSLEERKRWLKEVEGIVEKEFLRKDDYYN